MILNLHEMPKDPIERLMWLSGVKEAAERELDEAYQRAYYDARISGRMLSAFSLRLHSKKNALKFTRRENNASGRMIRWGDGLDESSTAYRG